VFVRNPVVPNRIMQVPLHPEKVDCIVFWTKNFAPMLDKVKFIRELGYACYIQYTLNSYGKDLEPGMPRSASRIDDVKRLCDAVGPECIIWRYDPVIVSQRYTREYHVEAFGRTADHLHGHIRSCVFSFIDVYHKIKGLFSPVSREEQWRIAQDFSHIAYTYDMPISACAEEEDFSSCGIPPSRCIDPVIIRQITGKNLLSGKDRGQRPACRCMKSVDIGSYGTCRHGCRYCYASSQAKKKHIDHDECSPMLEGKMKENDILQEIRNQPR